MSSSSRTSKRQRTLPAFGAPSDADSSPTLHDVPSSTASSIRHVAPTSVPSLTVLCARIFAANFVNLRNNESSWERLSEQLQVIPDTLITKLFSVLKATCPTYLKHEFIVAVRFNFLSHAVYQMCILDSICSEGYLSLSQANFPA
jgi:hypothetical protein